MSAQRHIIKRQVLELTLDKTRDAWPLQQELSRIYRQRLVPLIERYCDELSAPDRLHRIDLLELDLGPIDPDQLEADLVAKVGAALRRRLAEQIGGQENVAVPPDKIPKTVSQLELFSLFARQGSLPWWADRAQPQLLEDSLQYLLRHAPDRLRRLLRELAGEETPLQRLIQHYDDRRLTALAALLAPALAAFPAPFPQVLAAICQHAAEYDPKSGLDRVQQNPSTTQAGAVGAAPSPRLGQEPPVIAPKAALLRVTPVNVVPLPTLVSPTLEGSEMRAFLAGAVRPHPHPDPLAEGEATAFAVHARQSQFNQRLDSRTGFQAQLRRHIWHSILQVAALSEELYREPLPFCRAVLLQLAGVLRLPYTALLTGLRQVLPTAATGVQSLLRDMVGILAEELAAPAAPSQRG